MATMANLLVGFHSLIRNTLLLAACSLSANVSIGAQTKLAIASASDSAPKPIEERIHSAVKQRVEVLDENLTSSVIKASGHTNLFNLSIDEARNLAAAAGSDFLLITRADTTRRFSTVKREYFESFVVIFLVSGRTGHLVFSTVKSAESKAARESENELMNSADTLVNEIVSTMKETNRRESLEKVPAKFSLPPDENSLEAKTFRPPLPYRRLKPAYTPLADLYSVEATVDVLVDVAANGDILRTEISRWAGFGLDESVIATIKNMRWRPATQNGKVLPVRVLLRYNFTNINKTN